MNAVMWPSEVSQRRMSSNKGTREAVNFQKGETRIAGTGRR